MRNEAELQHGIAQGNGILLGRRDGGGVHHPTNRFAPHETAAVLPQPPVAVAHLHLPLHALCQSHDFLALQRVRQPTILHNMHMQLTQRPMILLRGDCSLIAESGTDKASSAANARNREIGKLGISA